MPNSSLHDCSTTDTTDTTCLSGVRIWRWPESDFNGDEPLDAAEVYTGEAFATIRDAGFNAVWLRGRLFELMRGTSLPELESVDASRRTESLQIAMRRARSEGVDVFLYFHEPLALATNHPLWQRRPDLRGRWQDHPLTGEVYSLCTSHPDTQRFMSEAIDSVLTELPDLAGVILTTATEYPAHCWSHYARCSLDDGNVETANEPLDCDRCAEREPAEIVGELVSLWTASAARVAPSLRVLAWNWSWSIWYPDPQAEVMQALPDRITLLVDWERGSAIIRGHHTLTLDEYALGFPGPSDRFIATKRAAADRGLEVGAKMQIGTTHELATVPNLPLIDSLWQKLRGLREHGVRDVMACWNFGCSLTLNTEAVRFFADHTESFDDSWEFMRALATHYFGKQVDADSVAEAWRHFSRSFDDYPMTNRFIYWSPLNYAPAFALLPTYRDAPLGWSFVDHRAFGDRVEDCLPPFSTEEALSLFGKMHERWSEGLKHYRSALNSMATPGQSQTRHACEELICAQMIGCHLAAMCNVLRFTQWRSITMQRRGLTGPCRLPLDEQARAVMEDQLTVMGRALDLARQDPRLGFHQEAKAYLCGADQIEAAMESMRRSS